MPRRAILYVPGNDERKLNKIPALDLDCVVMDCEDGVAINRKVGNKTKMTCSVCVLQMTRHVSFSFFLVYKQFDARCCVVNLQINQ